MKNVIFKDLFTWVRSHPATTAVWGMISVLLLFPFLILRSESDALGSNIHSIGDGLWYGLVTMLTVGYGDRYATTMPGRLFSVVMMVAGVIGMAIVTARISSIFLEKAMRDRRGLVDQKLLNRHFIVCGWKPEMGQLLANIIIGAGIKSDQILLVNNAPESEYESLQEIAVLKGVKWVKGDFFQIEVLKRAVPEKAQKILILADATPGSDGAVPTRTEADARTVMTAMTLSNIAKGTPVAAEVLDAQMDQYLKLAHVHEIIYSRDYSRLLLAMASTGAGVTNIFHDLLDPSSTHHLTTVDLPTDLPGDSKFSDLRRLFQQSHPGDFLMGILENSGNGHLAKETALKKAQQTPNIKMLVQNLQSVKQLRFNLPVFSPADDYPIREGSRAIVIRRRRSHAEPHV